MRFEAVIFDMDGVLIDSEPLWQDAEIEVFNSIGIHMTREMCRTTMGKRVDEVVDHWHGIFGWEGPSPAEVVGSIVARMEALLVERGELLPGVLGSLEYLRGRVAGIGLASSSWMRLIDTVLDTFDLRSHFDVVRSAASEPAGKPHPGVYLATASDLGVPPERCLAVEDSPNGVASAKAAGMFCVGVPDGSHVDLGNADLIIGSLLELPSAWGSLEVKRPSTN